MTEMRINKFIRECGVASRREADLLVEEGRVFINGIKADAGLKVKEVDLVTVDGKEIKPVESKHIVAVYKPVGVVCTKKDEHAKLTIADVFSYPYVLTYAGRLDKDSEGLLLMTDDGELIDKMMRSRYDHEKEYVIELKKPITDEFLKRFEKGVFLHELDVVTKPCTIRKTGPKKATVILTQGLNRQIRRMCKELGNEVVFLKRVRVVNIGLGSLKPGEYRELTKEEQSVLYHKLGIKG